MGPTNKKDGKTVFEKLQIPTPITTKKNYLQFLDLTGKIAFELCKRKNTPLHLIDNLTEVLENLPLQSRNSVLEALNSFIDHEETALWLNGFTGHSENDVNTIYAAVIT